MSCYEEEEEEEEEMERSAAGVPAWLQGLLEETFFGSCGVHENRRKNEKNIFCLNCCQSFCPHCLPSHHPSHPLLQVRRYVYQDVVRLDDIEKLIDCSYIQAYTINGAKVIFLNQRAQQSRSSCKGGGSASSVCFTCDRILQDPFHFCSLSCKVDHMVYNNGEDLSSILYMSMQFDQQLQGGSHSHQLSISQFEGLRLRVDAPNQYGSSNSEMQEGATSTSERKEGFRFPGGIMLSFSSRRKGAPQRSPLA